MLGKIKLRRGLSVDVARADPKIQLGEIIYITDKQALCVGDGKGGITAVTQIVKGPDDGLYTKIDGIGGYVPLSIKV